MATTRRHFLETTAAAPLAAAQHRRVSANDHIQFATIGVGGMGSEDTRSARAQQGVKLVAVCDLYNGRLERAREVWGRDIEIGRAHV